jgi:hypothetical protein
MAVKIDKTKLVRNLAAKHKLVPLLEREILKGEQPWGFEFTPKESDDGWHPSGDCTPSLLELYHKAKGIGPVKDWSHLSKAFMVGHFWHAWLQHICLDRLQVCESWAIERRGIKGWGTMGTKEAEVRYFPHFKDPILWKPFHYATGSGDLAPASIPGHGDYVVDFKTMGTHDFKRQGVPDWCSDKYECQINVYMDFFDVDKAIILAILKDSPHDMKEFEYVRNQPLIDAIYQKWELVSACLDEGIEPPADEEIHLPLTGPIAV